MMCAAIKRIIAFPYIRLCSAAPLWARGSQSGPLLQFGETCFDSRCPSASFPAFLAGGGWERFRLPGQFFTPSDAWGYVKIVAARKENNG